MNNQHQLIIIDKSIKQIKLLLHELTEQTIYHTDNIKYPCVKLFNPDTIYGTVDILDDSNDNGILIGYTHDHINLIFETSDATRVVPINTLCNFEIDSVQDIKFFLEYQVDKPKQLGLRSFLRHTPNSYFR